MLRVSSFTHLVCNYLRRECPNFPLFRGRPNTRVTGRHFGHSNASRAFMSRLFRSG